MRDGKWLQMLLDETWDQFFSDVPQHNIVRIEFGRRAKNRLGSIRLDPKDPEVSIITMNGVFKKSVVPEFVVQATLVHEMCHYAHGFNSPLQQRFRHPHAGGVMRREFAERGLEELYVKQKRWLKENWRVIVEQELGSHRVRRTKPAADPSVKIPKPFWFR